MQNITRKRIRFLIWGIASLLLGTAIYVLFRENTYFSKLVLTKIDITQIKQNLLFLDNAFVKYYFPDFLWAFSLNCLLHAIYLPNVKGSVKCSLIAFLTGVLYEVFQCLNIVSGTGDLVDVLLYLLAVVTVIFINQKGRREK